MTLPSWLDSGKGAHKNLGFDLEKEVRGRSPRFAGGRAGFWDSTGSDAALPQSSPPTEHVLLPGSRSPAARLSSEPFAWVVGVVSALTVVVPAGHY